MIRLSVLGLLVAIVVGAGVSGWALLSAEGDSTFRPAIIRDDPIFHATIIQWEGTPVPTPPPGYSAPPLPVPPQSEFHRATPRPPTELEARAIELAMADPQVQEMTRGHRLGAPGAGQYIGTPGECNERYYYPCFSVGVYDYTVPIYVSVIVNVVTGEVVWRGQNTEYQPDPTAEELTQVQALVEADPRVGAGAVLVLSPPGAVKTQISGIPGSRCGSSSYDHRCVLVTARTPAGAVFYVAVDFTDLNVAAVYEGSRRLPDASPSP